MAKGNYGASWGNTQWDQTDLTVAGVTVAYQRSAFGHDGNIVFATVTDGLSMTVFLSELRQGAENDIRGMIWTSSAGGGTSSAGSGPTASRDFYGAPTGRPVESGGDLRQRAQAPMRRDGQRHAPAMPPRGASTPAGST